MPVPATSAVLVSRYRLESRIAGGGMGEVWRAADLVLDRQVAVKLLRPEYAQHPETLARFRAEARHAAALSHPAIAQVYDYGDAGQGHAPFLVMELVDGRPLTELLAAGPLAPAAALDVVAQVAAGLAAAHVAGVLHRDIKPGNLLLCADGRVKITDFGISYAAGSAPLTRTGTVIGTPGYLAPERLAGAGPGPSGDLYSLGMVAYECLAGRLPFTGTAIEIALAHQHRPLPALPASVPDDVAALIADLTDRDPAMRPGSAAQVAARAAALRDAHAGTAGPPTVPPGPTLTGLPGLADTAYLGVPGNLGQHPAMPSGPRPRSHGARLLAGAAAVAVAVILGLGGWLLASSAGSAAHGPGSTPRASSPGGLVSVDPAVYLGRPTRFAVHRLRALGFQVSVTGQRDAHQRPGTVLSVSPQGPQPVGTTISLTVAIRPGEGHDHGRGHGDGNGNGQGGD